MDIRERAQALYIKGCKQYGITPDWDSLSDELKTEYIMMAAK